MSEEQEEQKVLNHRHCQATVLGATGDPPLNGITWETISNLVPELTKLEDGWIRYFQRNENVTEDLAGILKLINWLAGKIQAMSAPQATRPGAGDIINVTGDTTVNVKNDINTGYAGVVGITRGNGRKLTACPISVTNVHEDDGEVIAWLNVGNQRLPIKGLPGGTPDQPEPGERYIITEDEAHDIVLSGGANDGAFLDYN